MKKPNKRVVRNKNANPIGKAICEIIQTHANKGKFQAAKKIIEAAPSLYKPTNALADQMLLLAIEQGDYDDITDAIKACKRKKLSEKETLAMFNTGDIDSITSLVRFGVSYFWTQETVDLWFDKAMNFASIEPEGVLNFIPKRTRLKPSDKAIQHFKENAVKHKYGNSLTRLQTSGLVVLDKKETAVILDGMLNQELIYISDIESLAKFKKGQVDPHTSAQIVRKFIDRNGNDRFGEHFLSLLAKIAVNNFSFEHRNLTDEIVGKAVRELMPTLVRSLPIDETVFQELTTDKYRRFWRGKECEPGD